jgi:small-conductance mechanosensitive channel
MSENLIEWIEQHWMIDPSIQRKIFYSILALVILFVLRYVANKLIYRSFSDVKVRYLWKNGVKNTFYVMVLLVILTIWMENIGSLATFLGLFSAGLAIALQSPIVNLAAYLFIIIRKPFELGDRIEIGDHAGDVIDIRFFQFTINEIGNWVDADQSTGRIIHIPNGQVFNISQANYNQGFSHIWHEIGVMVTFESNYKKAKGILEEVINTHAEQLSERAENVLREASKKFMIFYSQLTPFVYIKVHDSGVMLTIRYLTLPKRKRISEHKIWEDILDRFALEDDIDFAYPTQRIYYNLKEGKKGTVKPPPGFPDLTEE